MYGPYGTANVSYNLDMLQAFGQGDVLGCYLDLLDMAIYYTKNGEDLGEAFRIPGHMRKSNFHAAVVLKVRQDGTCWFQLTELSV